MMNSLTADEITMLSGSQIVDHCKRAENFVLAARGNKLTSLENVDDDIISKQEECMRNLNELLSLERVLTAKKLARGVYEQDKNRVRILNITGKWEMGYFEDCVHYLRPYEALFLMEMCKVEVTFNDVIMSIEQGYAIFLDEINEISFEDYVVFSFLSRIGYQVNLHNPEDVRINLEEVAERTYEDNEEKMIWCVLMERLEQPILDSFKNEEMTLYEKTAKRMDQLNENICGKRESFEKDFEEPSSKKIKLETKISEDERSFLDLLKSETEFTTYQEIFNKFSFIKSAKEFPTATRELKFAFDVFLPNLKKTEKFQSYRIVVVRSTDDFPTNAELEILIRLQRTEVPVLIVIVSESMTTHFCSFK